MATESYSSQDVRTKLGVTDYTAVLHSVRQILDPEETEAAIGWISLAQGQVPHHSIRYLRTELEPGLPVLRRGHLSKQALND